MFKLFISKNIILFISLTKNLNGIDGYLSVQNHYSNLSTPIVSLTVNILFHKIIFPAKAFPPKYDHINRFAIKNSSEIEKKDIT